MAMSATYALPTGAARAPEIASADCGIRPATVNEAGQPAVIPTLTGAASQPRGTELIPIAEDHESIREMARHTLLNLGYRVLSAAIGEEALRVDLEEPALAVSDVVMPKLGGQATSVRLLERFPGVLPAGIVKILRGLRGRVRE